MCELGSFTALPPAHELGTKLGWLRRACTLPVIAHELIPLADMLLQLAEDQEAAILRPCRLWLNSRT